MFNISVDESERNFKMWTSFIEKAMQSDHTFSKYLYSSIMLIIFLASLCGNVLTCYVVITDRSMHTATNYYLLNLAATDLMLTFAILTEISIHLMKQYSQLLCLIHWFIVGCLWNNSVLTMTALSLERYIAIWHPMMLNSTPVWRRVLKVISVMWLLAIIETAPELLSVDIIKTSTSVVCFTIPTPFSKTLNGVLAILTFLIPLTIMTFVYSMIVFKVNATQQKNSRDKVFNHRDPRGKVNRLVVAMTVSFFVCWSPYFILRVFICLLDIDKLPGLTEWWYLAYTVVNVNSWFSIVLNPILFSLMSTKFRKSLKCLWNLKIKRSVISDSA